MKSSLIVIGLGASALFVACGGGSSGVNSGVDGTKKASDVTPDEAKKICQAVVDYTASKTSSISKDQSCNYGIAIALKTSASLPGVTDEVLKQACTSAKDACSKSTTTEQPSTNNTCDNAATPTGCTATVDELEACATDIANAFANNITSVETIDCATVTKDSLPEVSLVPEIPESCTSLPATCASVTGASGSGTSTGGGAGGAGGAAP